MEISERERGGGEGEREKAQRSEGEIDGEIESCLGIGRERNKEKLWSEIYKKKKTERERGEI